MSLVRETTEGQVPVEGRKTSDSKSDSEDQSREARKIAKDAEKAEKAEVQESRKIAREEKMAERKADNKARRQSDQEARAARKEARKAHRIKSGEREVNSAKNTGSTMAAVGSAVLAGLAIAAQLSWIAVSPPGWGTIVFAAIAVALIIGGAIVGLCKSGKKKEVNKLKGQETPGLVAKETMGAVNTSLQGISKATGTIGMGAKAPAGNTATA